MLRIFNDYYIDSDNIDIRNDIIFPDSIKKYNLFDVVRINDGSLLINKVNDSNFLIDIYQKDDKKGINIESDVESNIYFKIKDHNNITKLIKNSNNILDIYENENLIISIKEDETLIRNKINSNIIDCSELNINGTNIFDLFLSNIDAQNTLNSILNEAKQYTNTTAQNLTFYINSNFYTRSDLNDLYNELDTLLRQYTDTQIYTNLLNYYTKIEIDNLLNNVFTGLINTEIQSTKDWVSNNFFNKITGDTIYGDSRLKTAAKLFLGDDAENDSTIFLGRTNVANGVATNVDFSFDGQTNWQSKLSKFRILETNKNIESFSVEASTGNVYIDGNLKVNKNTDIVGNLKLTGTLDFLGSFTQNTINHLNNSHIHDIRYYTKNEVDDLIDNIVITPQQIGPVIFNTQVIAENIIIPSGMNAHSVGDITIENGYTVTVENGSVYKII